MPPGEQYIDPLPDFFASGRFCIVDGLKRLIKYGKARSSRIKTILLTFAVAGTAAH